MDIDKIISILEKRNTEISSEIFDNLKCLKKQAILDNNEKLANDIWYYETVAKIQKNFLIVYSLLKEDVYDKYYDSWCLIEEIEILLGQIRNNYIDRISDFNLSFIGKIIYNLEKMFPYKFFLSRENIIKSSKCSICDKKTSIRNPCSHQVGKLYNGEICREVVTDMKFIGVSLVKDPFDKHCVAFLKGRKYDYSLLKALMQKWDNPYDEWDLRILKIKKPEYREISRKKICPCGSGKKYKRCCLNTSKELMDHFEILYPNKNFGRTPLKIYNTIVKTD
ncbi:MAG: SEC-C domain-containing protein [Oscillospiraceae bacterium]|jgi:hypothetical protein|nr:SEC-C domain-containing protein [Oscillospiraceae bacterium]